MTEEGRGKDRSRRLIDRPAEKGREEEERVQSRGEQLLSSCSLRLYGNW